MNNLVNGYDNRPCYSVFINGNPIYDITQIQIDRSHDQAAATARLTTPNHYPHNPGEVEVVQVFNGYNGQTAIDFTGYIDDVVDGVFPQTWEIVCRDPIKLAIETWIDSTGVTYTAAQAETAVVDLLSKAGIVNVDAGATNFTIGDVYPTVFKLVSIWDAVSQIAQLIGWQVWATNDGTVHFRYRKPLPGSASVWTYREGDSSDGKILKYSYTKTDRNLRNRVEVVGHGDIIATARGSSPYVNQDRTAILASDIIDTQSMAQGIANWMVHDLNHLTESIEMDVPGNPLLNVGQTITVYESTSGQNGARYYVFSKRTTNNGQSEGYKDHLIVVGGNSSPIIFPPPGTNLVVASFTYKQTAWADPTYALYVDASASYSPFGNIVNYNWTWGDGSTAENMSTPRYSHKFPAKGTYTVTLVVTDSIGKTGTCSKTIKIGTVTDGFVYRSIFEGGTSYIYGSKDSGLTWNKSSIGSRCNHIATNVSVEEGLTVAGLEDGKLYSVLDYAKSIALLYTFPNSVRAVYVASDDMTVLVGLSSGELYESTDGGASFILLNTLPGAIVRIAYLDETDKSHILVAGVAFLRESRDNGATFSDLLPNFSNGEMTAVNYFALHMLQYMGIATVGGTKQVGMSADGGATWTPATGIIGDTPLSITGDPFAAAEYLVSMFAQNYAWITTDGSTYLPGGYFNYIYQANEIKFDWEFYATAFAAGGTSGEY